MIPQTCLAAVGIIVDIDVLGCRHVHAYERCNRVYNYTVDPCGPVHVTIGDGGMEAFSPSSQMKFARFACSQFCIHLSVGACCSEVRTRGLAEELVIHCLLKTWISKIWPRISHACLRVNQYCEYVKTTLSNDINALSKSTGWR